MANLKEIASYLDKELRIDKFKDSANNGLQVDGKKEVKRIAVSVDACQEVFEKAKEFGADMVITHHALIWGGVGKIMNNNQRRLKVLLENKMSLYVAHLPLDGHQEFGNAAVIYEMLGLKKKKPFGVYEGSYVGVEGELKKELSFNELKSVLEKALQVSCLAWHFSDKKVKRIGIVTGSGSELVFEAEEKGVDVLITGEPRHSKYHDAKELGVNVLFAGHYATETLGVKELAKVLEKKFMVKTKFIDVPTGL